MPPIVFAALLVASLLVPLAADALPKGAVGYILYHKEGSDWVRYRQGDPFPPGGGTPPTNMWKYEYGVENHGFNLNAKIYKFIIFFNSELLPTATLSSYQWPTGWQDSTVYYPPTPPNNNWKIMFRGYPSLYYVPKDDTLYGFAVQFTWTAETAPGPQNYDLVSTSGSESGVTHEFPPYITAVEATTWGRIKSLFR
jgi:hypothetical protein